MTDVLSLGCAAIDDILSVDAPAEPDGKREVRRRERRLGGLGAAAIVAAARLGARCAYAGVLGEDDASYFVRSTLRLEGIEVASPTIAGAAPVQATVVVSASPPTRQIYFMVPPILGAHAAVPEAQIAAARVLHLDHHGVEAGVRAAQIARRAGAGVVADLEGDGHPRFRELLAAIDHLVLSQTFATHLTGFTDPVAAARGLWTGSRSAVVVTTGAKGCVAIGSDDPMNVLRFPAFQVEAIDTTGCGDVFHGAYAAALAAGVPLIERLRLASAAAALTAHIGQGAAGAPTRAAVDAFLARNRP